VARWPVDGEPKIASPYLDPRRGPGHPAPLDHAHYGIDLAGRLGDAIRAPEAMTILETVSSASPERPNNTAIAAPWTGYGPGIVVARGESGKCHLLAHLRTTSVVRGQAVPEGALVGTMGKPGAAGPHVHWEVRDNARDTGPPESGGNRDTTTTDPHAWLEEHGDTSSIPSPRARGLDGLLILGLLWLVIRRA
jgi:murein DD-endopeptidase MepM/ murein hydrolase activator NlpD